MIVSVEVASNCRGPLALDDFHPRLLAWPSAPGRDAAALIMRRRSPARRGAVIPETAGEI